MPNKNNVEGVVEDIANDQGDVGRIRKDLETLKNDVVSLTKSIQEEGMQQSRYYTDRARQSVSDVREAGERGIQTLEDHVHEKPAQSLLIAFAAGIVFSFLMGRR